jgi:hypothetical protein
MISFTCSNKDCINKEIENNFRGFDKVAICSGCSTVLVGYNEQPDPEIPAEIAE